MNGSQPQLWVFAGPNGAGKSTLVGWYKIANRILVVNPDEIARTIRPHHSHEASILNQAGRLTVAQREQLLEENRSFGIETTLTGRGELHLMETAKERGYKVNLIYIGLSEPTQSNSRVAARVKLGGHDISEQDVFRRFSRSLGNLADAIKTSDRVRILDNSGKNYRLLLSIDRGRVKTISRNLLEWAKTAILKELLRSRCSFDIDY